MSAPGRLFGVKAIVFGAASGVGEAIARIYSKHEALVLAVDEPASGISAQLAAVAGVTALPLSSQDGDSPGAAVAAAQKTLGGIDVIVNSFLLQPPEPIDSEAALSAQLEPRLARIRAHFDAALPQLKKSPSGRVISLGFIRSAFTRGAHDLAARAEEALARQTGELAAVTGQDGITVNFIQPGAVMTMESRRIFTSDKAFRDHCIRRSAARRLGDPIDVAKLALFLASDDAAFVSGTGIRVDGGRSDT